MLGPAPCSRFWEHMARRWQIPDPGATTTCLLTQKIGVSQKGSSSRFDAYNLFWATKLQT